jgi:hypothetical protein
MYIFFLLVVGYISYTIYLYQLHSRRGGDKIDSGNGAITLLFQPTMVISAEITTGISTGISTGYPQEYL